VTALLGSPLAGLFARTHRQIVLPTTPGGPAPIDRLYAPFPGPQSLFDAASEFEVLYGGAKGPGKSHALLGKPLRWVHHPQFKGLLLRTDFPSLREVIRRSQRWYRRLGATWNVAATTWTFPSGASIEFGYGRTLADIERYQGREPTWLGYDEIGQLADENVWTTLLAELRSPDPALPTQACASANPGGPGEPWLVKRFVKPCGADGARIYADPVEPTMTRRFIPARVTDNPIYAGDAKYLATLRTLPKRRREQLLEGKWGIGTGRGLDELDERRHLIPRRPVQRDWDVWGAFDWGFGHPFAFGWFARDPQGQTYLVDTIHGHRLLPWEQAARIEARVPEKARSLVYAGHDCWAVRRARGENTPTIAETFQEYGITLVQASIDRVQGLNNLREYVKWQGPDETVWTPRLLVMDTPGNRRTFEVLESMMVDPDDLEDVVKRDADPETGEGGDDAYDMVRYGLAARRLLPRAEAAPRAQDRHPGFRAQEGRSRAVRPADEGLAAPRDRVFGGAERAGVARPAATVTRYGR
jgi:hypothetical protein